MNHNRVDCNAIPLLWRALFSPILCHSVLFCALNAGVLFGTQLFTTEAYCIRLVLTESSGFLMYSTIERNNNTIIMRFFISAHNLTNTTALLHIRRQFSVTQARECSQLNRQFTTGETLGLWDSAGVPNITLVRHIGHLDSTRVH